MKKCSNCFEIKSLDSFPKRVAVANGKSAQCKQCVSKYKANLYKENIAIERQKRRNHYRKHQDKIKETNRAYYQRTSSISNVARRCRKRGITVERYYEMLNEQKYCCKTCKKYLVEGERSIDHCHKTNKVRGILCDNCNTAIGLLKDDPIIIKNVLGYLEI